MMKLCRKCGNKKPATCEFFTINGYTKKGQIKWRSWCKPCKYANDTKQRKLSWQKHPEKHEHYLQYMRNWNSTELAKESKRSWVKRNPNKVRANYEAQNAKLEVKMRKSKWSRENRIKFFEKELKEKFN